MIFLVVCSAVYTFNRRAIELYAGT